MDGNANVEQAALGDDVLVMLDTVRAEVTEEIKALGHTLQATKVPKYEDLQALTTAIEKTCDTLLRRLDEPVVPGLQGSLDEILQVMRAEKQAPRLDWRRLAGLGGALVLLSGLAGWSVGHPPRVVRQQASLMQHVNAVLVEKPSALPADVRAKLAAVYRQHGFPTVEQQGGKP